jgi:hypothetical protein
MKEKLCPVCRQPLSDEKALQHVRKKLEALKQSARATMDVEVKRARAAGEKTERERQARARTRMSKLAKQMDARMQQMDARMAGLRKENARLQTQLSEKQSSDDKGALGEMRVLDALQRAFPTDVIEPLKKTKGSADIRHEVREKGVSCGLIVYECKNVLSWDSKFVEQARALRAAYNTRNVILVSNAFPSGARDVAILQGIPLVHPTLVVQIATFIRDAVAALGQQEHSGEDRERKGVQLMEYIVSDEFVVQMKRIADAAGALQDLQRRERAAHDKTWSDQTKYFKLVEDGGSAVRSRVDSIIDGRAPVEEPSKSNGNGHAAQPLQQ